MTSLKVAKDLLRKDILSRISKLDSTDKLRQSQYVYLKVIASLDYKKSKSIAIYLHTQDEIQTFQLVKHMFQNNKRCFIPRYNSKKAEMVMLELRDLADLDALPLTRWKIKQPSFEDTSRADAMDEGLDMILMPGLAFTTTGHRMGRGGGFYDRYLSEYRGRHGRLPVLKAIAFKEQICDAVPVDDTDVDIDHVVYER